MFSVLVQYIRMHQQKDVSSFIISQSNLIWLQLSCAYSFKDISKIPTLFSSQEQGASKGISSFFVGLLV